MNCSTQQRGLTDRYIREDNRFFDASSSSTLDVHKVLPKERIELEKAIDYIATLEDGWNGYEAQAPSDLSIDAAKQFVALVPLNRLYPSKVSPNGEGGVMFTWQSPTERILLTVEGTLVHLSHERQGQPDEFEDEILFDFSVIPDKVLTHIPIRNPAHNARAD